MSNRITTALLVSLCLAVPILAKNKNLPDANRVKILPRDLEIKLALSAAPKHLRAGAGVYVLEEAGYVKVRESSNGFNCYVGRPEFGVQVGSFEPICHNAEGSRTILPAALDNAKFRAQGMSIDEIDAKIREGFRNGTYKTPKKVGIVYMLSPFSRVAITSGNTMVYGGGGVLDPHPHIMYYGKELTREALGVRRFRDRERHHWEPVLTGQNSPFAYIVQPIGKAAVEEIMNHPESQALIKAMQSYLK